MAVQRSSWLRRSRLAGAAASILLGCGPVWCQAQQSQKPSQPSTDDLTQVSLENLMNMEVTSVSKKEQKLSQVAAAIFVITQEDIRRSGATKIPDLLLMVPGLDVAQINSNTWAISARGFNVVGQNLLQDHHLEFNDALQLVNSSQVMKFTSRF